MKLIFYIDYRTNWGESVYLTGSIAELGGGDLSKAVKLDMHGSQLWTKEVEIDDNTGDFTYSYAVIHDNGYIRHEWGTGHRFSSCRNARVCQIFDRWHEQPADKPCYSSAFTDCICRREHRDKPLSPKRGLLNLRVSAPMILPDEVLAISGSIEALGNWDPSRAIRMNDARFPEWEANIELKKLTIPFEYKFIILKKETGKVVSWENCDNRTFSCLPADPNEIMTVAGLRLAYPRSPWKGAGTAIPVFSLRSNDDCGSGDFYDLMPMVDWAVMTGQSFIQILPINDTTMTRTWTDSYPYNANSTFALHPMYLRPGAIGTLKDKERQAEFDRLGHELNQLPTVDYERVTRLKDDYVKALFAQDGKATMATADFRQFVKTNSHWLTPYAAFCVLRDLHGSADFSTWGEYATYEPERIAAFVDSHADEINYVYFVQYHLDRQMRHVRAYANSRGVALKGDIPIGISRNSVDAWLSPRLFNLDCQAGAPPDDFSVLGQNWGFPTYNWEEMSLDGFQWWKSRMRKMAEYFDAFRIDHVLGFFRIWQIPMDALHGLLGIFNPALPYTPEELRHNYDFWLNIDLHTYPYITEQVLLDQFGELTDEARTRYLDNLGNGRYRLKPAFATQRQVADYFASLDKNARHDKLCDALMNLIDDVLFIEDPYQKGKYHPRISARQTYVYKSLSDYEKWCFDRLYNDFFYHRHNDFWYGKAMWKLPPLLDATDMLVCAEDLGMIPACVPAVMDALEILSLEIQRMPKDPATPFGNTWTYPYHSVCTTSTHDMGGIRQWWEENRDLTQRYYNEVLREPGEAPMYAEPWICDKILSLNLSAPSMLAIFPLQDWLSASGNLRRENPRDEQINVPANPRHYWRYRMHLTIEDLIADNAFNSMIRDMISRSGR